MFLLFKRAVLLIAILCTGLAYCQEQYTLSGTVRDSDGLTLPGASLYIQELQTGASSNDRGFYTLTVPAGTYTLTIKFIGYTDVTETVTITGNQSRNFSLAPDTRQLQEVVITQNIKKADIRTPEMSVNKLTAQDIKKMPAVLGEVDVIRSLLQLPGVSNAGEGTGGFNVRGGAADQNLILLDDATLFNSSHLFGFFSVFNSDAIKNLRLYKGGIPARFGGRASSVLDISQRTGNDSVFHATGGIGLISSRLVAEGPIVKDKLSYLFGGRTSYAHLFLKLTDNDNTAYFYDLNGRLDYKLNPNNNFYFSGYLGRDVIKINDSFTNIYGNTALNFGWNHDFNESLTSGLAFIYSDYLYNMTLDFIGFNWDSGIRSYTLKYDFKHTLNNKFALDYGISSIYYTFNPGTISPSSDESGINFRQIDKKYASENAVYIDANQKITEDLSITYGLRYSMFYRLGKQQVSLYENNQAVTYDNELQIYEEGTPIGTRFYDSFESIAGFGNLEPRAGISYAFNDNESVKASYNRMAQYLHLISNTASATPLDVWTPSDDTFKPQLMDQVAFGYFKNFSNDTYSLEAETYYKTVKNRPDYIDGANLIANDAIERVVLNGKMRSYGLELLFRKNTGKLNGWISYTLSRSEQQTPGRTPEEKGINNGNWYLTGFDKLHNLAVTGVYDLNPRWSFSTIFALQSGRPVTFPNGQYQYGGLNIANYGNRNENRLPAYHHLDVSATYTPAGQESRKWKGEWVFSIYNLYNRMNAASITFRQNEDTGNNEAVRLSIFGIIPSVTYNFRF